MECKRNITIYVETVKESFGLIGIQLAKIYKENFDVSSEDPLKTASRLIWLRNETIKRLFLEARDGIVVSAYPMDFALQSCQKLGGGGGEQGGKLQQMSWGAARVQGGKRWAKPWKMLRFLVLLSSKSLFQF
jgi:hypothetical protein